MDIHQAEAAVVDGRACYLNGLLRLRAGQPREASSLLQRALRDRPEDTDVRRNLIRALLASEQYGDVLDQAAIALALMPDDAEMYFAQGTALSVLHRPLAARAALTRAVVQRPSLAAAWLHLGQVCVDLDNRAEAERHYRTAIRCNPALAQAFASLGDLLLNDGRLEAAIAACETAVRLAPGLAEAHCNLASALLLSGDMPRGLREYEWRKRHPAYRDDFPPLPGPYWSGDDPTGKVILVRAEVGFGDTIHLARYVLSIAERGGTPILQCDPKLVPLLSRMPGVVVLPRSARVEGYDAWIDMMSLPLALGGVPFPAGYLKAISVHAESRGFRVGIAWAGQRSIPAAVLAPLLTTQGVSFVDLQVAEGEGEAGRLARLADFAEMAALIATLDLVIAVDSPVAHLAGALGVPVWVLLSHVPDWRWQLNRDDSPWYASARLFRQSAPGDWDEAIRRVTGALAQKRSSP
jgi:tetratricopeptide (TPR) repeat protein